MNLNTIRHLNNWGGWNSPHYAINSGFNKRGIGKSFKGSKSWMLIKEGERSADAEN